MAYTMQDADAAQARADAARAYSRRAARHSKVCQEQATEHHRISDEAREDLTGRAPRGVVASGDN